MSIRHRVVAGAVWWSVDRSVYIFASLVSQVLLARELGASAFGIFSLIFAVGAIALPVIHAGLSGLVSKALLEHTDDDLKILQTGLSVRLAVAALVVLFAYLGWHFGVFERGGWVLLVLTAQAAVAFQIIEYRFQTALDAPALVPWRLTATLVSFGLKLTAILSHSPLGVLIVTFAAEFVLIALAHVVALRRVTGVWLTPRVDRMWFGWFADRAPLVMLAALLGAAYSRGDLLWLQWLGASAVDIGVYSLTAKLILASEAVSAVLVASFYPAIWRSREAGDRWSNGLQQGFDVLSLAAIGISVLIGLSAPFWVPEVFGSDFALTGFLLTAAMWSCLFSFSRVLMGRYLISENLLSISVLSQAAGLLTCLGANALLYPRVGVMGAAIANLLTYAISNWVIFFFFKSTRDVAWMAGKSFLIVFRWRDLALLGKAVRSTVRAS